MCDVTQGAKSSLITAVCKIIDENVPPEKITTRLIASRANVSIGTINYYFQSKDNLIDVALKYYVKNVIENAQMSFIQDICLPKSKLAVLLEFIFTFIAEHRTVCRIAILRNLKCADGDDNIQRMIEALLPYIRDIVGNDPQFIWFYSSLISFTAQNIFLRSDMVKQLYGFDFFDKPQRDAFAKALVGIVFKGYQPKQV